MHFVLKYDSQGNPSLVTSYDAPTGGNVVNQVLRQYNGLGQLTAEYQSHSGAVNINTTPSVQYAWTEMAGGQNNSRPTSMTYPSGYVVNYNYGAGLDSSISRLTSLSDSGGTLESYKYLGLATVVERDHPQNNVNLTYISQTGGTGDAGDQYTGLDRFGRVAEQNWYNASTHASTDDFRYTYDRDSNVLSRQNVVDAIFSESYQYDNLNQLTSFSRGTHTQSWTPDALGNFTTVTTDGVPQARTHNQQNEITLIAGAAPVTYDANGNTTADGSGKTFVYDAWNRLVAVKNGLTTLAAYGYNGLGERITETHGATTTDLYYSASWQVVEERVGGVAQARNVWSPVYVDALVLRDQSSQQNGVLDQRLYVQQDANRNVTALVNTAGVVVERYVYDAYGAVTVLAADWSARGTSSYNWLYLFQGKRYDGTAGLYDSRERVYSPTLMRPLQADPLGLGPDINDYRWEGDGATNAMDPSGLAPLVSPVISVIPPNVQISFAENAIKDPWEYGVEVPADLLRAAAWGLWTYSGAQPYDPGFKSDIAQNAPPWQDKEANGRYLVDQEIKVAEDGTILIVTDGAGKALGKVGSKFLGKAGTAAAEAMAEDASASSKFSRLRATVGFLKQEGISDCELRRNIIEAGLQGPIGLDCAYRTGPLPQTVP